MSQWGDERGRHWWVSRAWSGRRLGGPVGLLLSHPPFLRMLEVMQLRSGFNPATAQVLTYDPPPLSSCYRICGRLFNDAFYMQIM